MMMMIMWQSLVMMEKIAESSYSARRTRKKNAINSLLNTIICPMTVFNTYPLKNHEFWLYLKESNNLINSAVMTLSVVTNQVTATEICSGITSEYFIQISYDSHRYRCSWNRRTLKRRIDIYSFKFRQYRPPPSKLPYQWTKANYVMNTVYVKTFSGVISKLVTVTSFTLIEYIYFSTNIQGAYKLSEYFEKSYFHKY
jgi:hypothetical protein